jgi:hypothetical protein
VQGLDIPRDRFEIEVLNQGGGIQVAYSRADQKGRESDTFYDRVKAQFPGALSVIFGIQKGEENSNITRRLEAITASWFRDQYGPSWNVNLVAHEEWLREGAEIRAEARLTGQEWNGICRVPEVPTCALPVPTRIIASKPEEADALRDYAWKVSWSIKQTLALTIQVQEETFEMSLRYESPVFPTNPSLEMLWAGLWFSVDEDKVHTPETISRDQNNYDPICQKENQSLHIPWRQKLANGLQPRIPEDAGTPPIVIYGEKVELRLRNAEAIPGGWEGTVQTLFGADLQVAKIPSARWSYNVAMARPGEKAMV